MEGHRLGVLLWICVCVLDGVAGTCPSGKYGYMCSYQCHCAPDKCNTTFGCQSANCSLGWSGPTCEKENIAFNKSTTSSDGYTFPSSNAVNGDTKRNDDTKCILSAYNDPSITSAWWRVDLGQKTLIHDVIIYFRADYIVHRNGIQIYIADTAASPTDGVNCYNVTGNRDGSDISDVLNVTCSGEGRYLVLFTTTVNNDNGYKMPIMDFCEVEVNVCDPGTFGANCDNYCHCDGEVCNYITGVCPSGVCLPGWQQNKCDKERVNSYGEGCAHLCSSRNCSGTSSCNHVTGLCENGCILGWKDTDCTEVCDLGSYGTKCNQTCSNRKCKGDNSSCDHVAGKCDKGCMAGWNGTDCTHECVNSYGEGCAHLCSSRNCSGTSSCNHVTGLCENGCIPGWKNTDCTEACVKGVEYGAGCLGNCSAGMCKGGNVTCPRDTGRCESGCQPGWQGEDCATACVQGVEYGAGCIGNCNTRMCEGRDDTCPRDTGRCESGCQPGWKGEDCTQACIQGVEYGIGCMGNCGARMCEGGSGTCPRDTGQCESGCQSGWKGEDCTSEMVNENSVATTDPPFSHIIGVVIGLVVGVVLTLLLTVGVLLYLFRKGRLLWSRDLVKDVERKEIADYSMTLADNYTSISELPHTDGRNSQNKDYAGLDTETRADNKHYDVIQNKVYKNA